MATPDAPPALTIIIPTLNEAAALPGLLELLRAQEGISLELLVADGGSTDATPNLALAAGARLLTVTPPGRGRQMNQAAAQARHPELLFLHADTRWDNPRLLADAAAAMAAARHPHGEPVAGHFPVRFRRSGGGSDLGYRFHEAKSRLNHHECIHGDQGWWLHRATLHTLGGFDESLPFFEERRLALRIAQEGRWLLLPGEVETSARRFEQEGMARRDLLNALLMAMRAIGLEAFLQQAPGLYRTQERTTRLRLLPFFRLIHRLNREAPLRERLRRWRAVGGYVRRNLWQVYLWLDLGLFPHGPRPFAALHAGIGPWLRWLPWDTLAMGLTWAWFHLTWAGLRLTEKEADPP